jgi:RNA recognition motif-containing protein
MINIYVGNLPFSTTDSELQELFGQHGDIEEVQVITDRDTGRSRGFGFVKMRDDNAGRTAIEQLNGTDLGGRSIVVNEAKPRTDRGGPRRGPR